MSYLASVLILLLAIITLTVEGNINPKYQSARSNGFNYSPPPPPRHVALLPPRYKPPEIYIPAVPHSQPRKSRRPPPKS